MSKPTQDQKPTTKRPVVVQTPPARLSYDEACAFLNARTDVEKLRPTQVPGGTLRLDRMHALMAALDHPENQTRLVHVAGSKGKGSVCEMVTAALTGAGYATGLYTSPHLVDVRERIRVGSSIISQDDFAAAVSDVAAALPAVERKHGPATYFEALTASAFVYFAAQAVDVAVVEVGLGGRLDSTNVITPDVAAVAAIQLEHTQILGNTLELIAREKAGIFKPGVRAITIPQTPEVMNAFREVAASVGCQLSVVGEDIEFTSRFESSPELGPHHKVCLYTPRSSFEHLPVPLKGEHQAYNCGLALAILDALRERGVVLSELGVARGLAAASNPGRLELIHPSPRIMIDGAHTHDSIHALLRSIGSHLKYDNLIVVFGCSSDKNIPEMLAKLAQGADKIVFTKAEGSSRAAEPRDLQRKFAEISGKQTQIGATVRDAINIAHKAAQRDDLIMITGSFYIAGEAKRLFLEKASKKA